MKNLGKANQAIEQIDSICQYILDELYQFNIEFQNLKKNISKVQDQINQGFYDDGPFDDETP